MRKGTRLRGGGQQGDTAQKSPKEGMGLFPLNVAKQQESLPQNERCESQKCTLEPACSDRWKVLASYRQLDCERKNYGWVEVRNGDVAE